MENEEKMDKSCKEIHVFCGPMFSKKTSALRSQIPKAIMAKQTYIVVSYKDDKRYSDIGMVSHDGNIVSNAVKTLKLTSHFEELKKYDVVLIDEGQFFPDLFEISNKLANSGCYVYIAGLDTDKDMKPWPSMRDVISCAEHVTKLRSTCYRCGKDAHFTKFVELIPKEDKETSFSPHSQKKIGISGYLPTCRSCHSIEFTTIKEIDDYYKRVSKLRQFNKSLVTNRKHLNASI